LAESVERLAEFRTEYNQVRPHEALGMDVPAKHFQSSPRAYNPHPCEWEYEPGVLVKPLNSQGFLEYQQHRYFVCEPWPNSRSAHNGSKTNCW